MVGVLKSLIFQCPIFSPLLAVWDFRVRFCTSCRIHEHFLLSGIPRRFFHPSNRPFLVRGGFTNSIHHRVRTEPTASSSSDGTGRLADSA
jgi:hypothetical protein